MSGAPIERPVRFISAALRHWVSRQGCRAPGCSERICEPHHHPTRGAGGDDLSVMPLCRVHHDQAQLYRAPLTREWQDLMAAMTMRTFVLTADDLEWAAFIDERARFVDARPYARMPR